MNPLPMLRSKTGWLLLGILGLAAFLRLYGIRYGLPHHYFGDEVIEIHRALKLGAGQWDWELDRTMKGFYFYVLFVEYAFYFLFLFVTGKIQSAGDFALRFAADPTPFYLMGRVTTALLGTATVGVLYAFARRLGGGAVASLASSVFLAVAVHHVVDSHSVNLNVPVTFFSTTAFYFMLRLTEEPSRKHYLLTGLFVTLATLTKINLALLFVPFLAAHFWPLTQRPRPRAGSLLFHRRLLLTLAGCLALYVAANPGIVVNAGALLDRINIFYGSADVPDLFVVNYTGIDVSGLRYYAGTFLRSFGYGITSLGAGGLLLALFSRDRRHWVFLGFFVLFLATLCLAKGMYSHRYALPLFPLFALYAGLFFARVFRFIRARTVLVVLAALVLCIEPFSKSLARDIQFTRKDNRTLALEWFESNVPPGSRVFIHGHRTFPNYYTVPLKPSPESVQKSISRYEEKGDPKADLLRTFLKPSLEGATYDLLLSDDHRRGRGFEDYMALGMQYAVVSSLEDSVFLTEQGKRNFPHIADIYLQLMDPSKATLLMRFEHTAGRPGPEIRIYRILDPLTPQGEDVPVPQRKNPGAG